MKLEIFSCQYHLESLDFCQLRVGLTFVLKSLTINLKVGKPMGYFEFRPLRWSSGLLNRRWFSAGWQKFLLKSSTEFLNDWSKF